MSIKRLLFLAFFFLSLLAVGLSIVFGLLRFVNFAHGAFYLIGAYFCYQMTRWGMSFWLALVVVELLASSEGIGFMIVYGRQLFQLDIVLAAVVVVGVLGYLIDKLLGAAESHLLRWRKPGL